MLGDAPSRTLFCCSSRSSSTLCGGDRERPLAPRREEAVIPGRSPFKPQSAAVDNTCVVYVFTVCEYGGGEIVSCRLTCSEAFADGFELAVRTSIDEDTYYLVREEIGEGDNADHTATLEPWIEAA
jgi:hypothetical protein